MADFGLRKIPKSLLATTCVVALGFLMLIIGITSPGWVYVENKEISLLQSTGLFQYDIEGHIVSYPIESTSDFLKACQAMGILAILSATVMVSMTITGCVYCLKSNPLPKILIYICLTAGLAVAVFSVICIAVWIPKYYVDTIGTHNGIDKSIGYSFVLTVMGTAFLEIGGLMFWKLSREASQAGDILFL